MPFTIIRDEIARQSADAVIVPANTSLAIDGGAGLAVARIAGISKLQAACNMIGYCEVGHAVATHAFDFPARRIIHAVGPTWDGTDEARELLGQAYESALALTADLGAQSVAVPLISSGAQGCPPEISLHIAIAQVRWFLEANPDVEVRIVLFGADATDAGRKLFPGLEQFVDDAYAAAHEEVYAQGPTRVCGRPRERDEGLRAMAREAMALPDASSAATAASSSAPLTPASAKPRKRSTIGRIASSLPSHPFGKREKAGKMLADAPYQETPAEAPAARQAPAGKGAASQRALDEVLDGIDAPFSTTLLAIIDERGLDDAEVYKRANISRQHFSKIRSNPDYRPTKRTVLALAVALQLPLEETDDLLARAGLALSPASVADLIVRWFIERGDYDVFAINEALYAYDQPLLG